MLASCFHPLRAADTKARPNFIFYITDDISADDFGCYGNQVVQTPNVDKLARDGMLFRNAYLTTSSCSPSRCSIITARYPHNTGACELHTPLPPDQYMFPQTLKESGYYTFLAGKNHMGPATEKAFDVIDGGKGPGAQENWVQLLQERPKDRPFFCWLASYDAHREWEFNDKAPIYDPDKVKTPPMLFDGPKTRKDLADYYHEVSRTDYYLGELRKELQRQGIEDNTYIIYMSDNGRPFPRCKTRLYDSGIQTPFVVFGPTVAKGAKSDSLVSAIDVGPTVLELAGVKSDPRIQGVSITAVLQDPKAVVRKYVFAEHNWHVYQAHERMVRTGDWLYIRNAFPERLNMCVEATNNPAGSELWAEYRKGNLKPEQMDVMQQPRAAEELYNVAADPHQFKNLASDPEHAATLKQLRGGLDIWSKRTCDDVPQTPTPDRPRGGRIEHSAGGVMPGIASGAPHCNDPGPTLTAE
jgi:arylsulfatase